MFIPRARLSPRLRHILTCAGVFFFSTSGSEGLLMDVESGVFIPPGGETASSSAPRRTATVNGAVTWKMGKEGWLGGGGGGGGVTGSPRGRVLIINRLN